MDKRISENLFLEMGELLNSTLDEVSILRTFCNKVLSLFDAERVSILAVDPDIPTISRVSRFRWAMESLAGWPPPATVFWSRMWNKTPVFQKVCLDDTARVPLSVFL